MRDIKFYFTVSGTRPVVARVPTLREYFSVGRKHFPQVNPLRLRAGLQTPTRFSDPGTQNSLLVALVRPQLTSFRIIDSPPGLSLGIRNDMSDRSYRLANWSGIIAIPMNSRRQWHGKQVRLSVSRI